MSKKLFLTILLSAIVSCAFAGSKHHSIKCPIKGYKLVWNDEFEGRELDTSKWTYATGGGGWGNHEIQNYISSAQTAEVSNGTLKIHLYKDGDNVYSARIYGNRNTGFRYGYVEARLKLPTGKGTWPAFWMMPVKTVKGWPHDGEIDIMEEVGYDPDKVLSTLHCTQYNNGGTPKESMGKVVSGSQTGFHTYAMEWTADKMDFYIDGKKFFTYTNDGTPEAWPFDTAFYPILNLAWGGGWGGAKGIDESCLPAVYEIDYVRIFQK